MALTLHFGTGAGANASRTKKDKIEIRGAALAISGATNWAANFTVTVTFLPLLKAIGLTGAYVFYAIAAAISLPFVWLTVCETKDKTLEQMKDTTELNNFSGVRDR